MNDMIGAALSSVDAQLTAEQWADALWLAKHLPVPATHGPATPATQTRQSSSGDHTDDASEARPLEHLPIEGTPAVTEEGATLHFPAKNAAQVTGSIGPAVQVPSVAALPGTLPLLRSLRSLRLTRPSPHRSVVDERATAALIADSSIWTPVLRPCLIRRFDLAVVIDASQSMVIWSRTIAELLSLLEHLGAFHSIDVWRIDSDEPGVPLRRAAHGKNGPVHAPTEISDPTEHRVIVMVSDCVGRGWRDGSMAARLETWGKSDPIAVIQVLPQRMWRRCGPQFTPVRISARRAGASNAELMVTTRQGSAVDTDQGIVIPVMELDARWLEPWSRLTAGGLDHVNTMAMFSRAGPQQLGQALIEDSDLNATQRVYRFRNTSSPIAFQLAAFLAATPLSLPVIRLVQGAMLPESRPAHLAEFFLGRLIHAVNGDADPDSMLYEFHDGVRDLLLTRLRRSDTLQILHQVAEYISLRFGAPRDFRAILASSTSEAQTGLGMPFARILRQVLTALGGSYASFAAMLPDSVAQDQNLREIVEIVSSTRDIEGGSGAAASLLHTREGASGPELGGDVSTNGGAVPEGIAERPPAIFEGVPTRNPHFTGRETLLDDLKARLSSSVTALVPQALHGLGGVGKTQLAVEFCHRFANNYDLVLWIPAEQPALARSTLAQLSEKLKLPRYDDQSQAVAAVLQTLRRGEVYPRWILVFDNADRPEDLDALLPDIQGPGHILITSRNQRWSDLAKVLEVDVFTRQESVDLLERRSPGISRADADQLAEKLGDLPLALEQAAAWQAETGMPVSEYLRLLDERMEQLLDVTSLGNYPKSVAATWRIAFERLIDESPTSLQLLELCAFFGAEPIANQLMPMGRFALSLSEELRKTVADSISLGRAIRHLGRYALAKIDHPTNSVQVHRLVQAVLRERVTEEQAISYRVGVQEILAAYNPGDPDNQETWPQHAKISPHIVASGAVEGSTHDIRKLVLDQIRYFQNRGYFRDSAELGMLAYERWRNSTDLGTGHEDSLVCGRLLGISLRWLGQNDKARKINEDTFARQRRIFGEEHEHTLVTANSFGADLRLAGELKEARELGERTYVAHLRVFLEEDINTLHAASNHALNLRLAGRFHEATELDRRTLAHRLRVRGDGHPETLLSEMNLGLDYLYVGRYQEARRSLEQAIGGYERVFGGDHVPLLLAYRSLGIVMRRTGEFVLSHEIAVRNVESYRRRLGPNHWHTLAATMSLCNAMRAIGQNEQSAERARQLLDQCNELLGQHHHLTLACAANLAITLRQTGEVREARRMDEQVVAAFTAQVGKEHPWSLSVGNNLANDLYFDGEHAAALQLSRTTLERSRVVRGQDNAYTLAAAANHVLDLRTDGQEQEARALEIDTWHRIRALLGERHPDTVAAMTGVRIYAEIDPPPS